MKPVKATAPMARITGVGSFLPERVLRNSDLEKMVDTSDEWIIERTGIRERRLAPEGMATSDMATRAAMQALEYAGRTPGEVDLIVVATVTPDMLFPSTACLVQKNLKARQAAAFDLSAACSGFVYAVSMVSSLVACGVYKVALVIGADTLSRITDWEDRSTCVLFGDGAGAVILESGTDGSSPEAGGILGSYLGADGEGWEALSQPAGGSAMPASHSTVDSHLHYIKMNGNQVFKFAVRAMGNAVKECLEGCDLTGNDLALLIPHQANMRIIEAAAARIGIPMSRVVTNIDRYGNMSSASVPVALDEAVRSGRLTRGDIAVLVSFGGGLTWGAAALRW